MAGPPSIFSRWLPWDTTENPEYYSASGYVGPVDSDFSRYWVQLDLPLGAEIDYIYALVYDDDDTAEWTLRISAYEGAESGTTPFWWDIEQASTGVAGTPGYTRIDLDLFAGPVVVREWTDLNGDMANTMVSYSLELTTIGATDPTAVRFFGAAVNWRRNISPAPTSAAFGDISTGHAFFQHIEALVASGITAGCGGGNYCPNNGVTRGQMAVFLAKGLGLHWSD